MAIPTINTLKVLLLFIVTSSHTLSIVVSVVPFRITRNDAIVDRTPLCAKCGLSSQRFLLLSGDIRSFTLPTPHWQKKTSSGLQGQRTSLSVPFLLFGNRRDVVVIPEWMCFVTQRFKDCQIFYDAGPGDLGGTDHLRVERESFNILNRIDIRSLPASDDLSQKPDV